MGQSPSKRAENALRSSRVFQDALLTTYEECLNLTQHAFPGVRLYQLPHACKRIHTLLSISDNDCDPAFHFQQKWLPQPPSQLQIDNTLRKENLLSKSSLDLEEFQRFALALFKNMGISNALRAMGWYIPLGILAIMCTDLTVKRFPRIGVSYQNIDHVASKLAVSYTAATAAAVYYNLGA